LITKTSKVQNQLLRNNFAVEGAILAALEETQQIFDSLVSGYPGLQSMQFGLPQNKIIGDDIVISQTDYAKQALGIIEKQEENIEKIFYKAKISANDKENSTNQLKKSVCYFLLKRMSCNFPQLRCSVQRVPTS